ncbi:GAP family protein [Caldilinea sp.]|uniref:GAP family protein n=1 Tax=Caldilinea sp. TaxID=2293560 RepID=UPI002C354727|nr:GAP family protein [Caldilinea sp.]HRA64435.1 GAP family protein [Caldilinea sp.]
MSDVFIDLLPVILAATLAPIYPIIVLLLLQSERGLGKAIAFVTGAVAVRLVQGVIFGLVFAPAVDAETAAGLELIGPTLLTLLGVLLLVMGVKKWRKGGDDEDGNAPPAWMSALSDMTVLKAAGSGVLVILLAVKQWVFTLSAIGVIEEARPGMAAGVGLYLLFTLGTQILVVPPILAFAIAPQRSAAPLRRAQGWLQRHNRVIVATVSLVFGLFFLYRGITGLLAFRVM